MKRLLTILFVLVCTGAWAQQKTPQTVSGLNTQGVARDQFRVDSLFYMPVVDTTKNPGRAGVMIYKYSNKGTYIYDGTYWRLLGIAGDTTGLSAYLKIVDTTHKWIPVGRRLMDTAYAVNDTTLAISISGNVTNIPLPGRAATIPNLQQVLTAGNTVTEVGQGIRGNVSNSFAITNFDFDTIGYTTVLRLLQSNGGALFQMSPRAILMRAQDSVFVSGPTPKFSVEVPSYFYRKLLAIDTLATPNIASKPLDTTLYKLDVIDGSGNHFKSPWPTFGGGGSGVTQVNTGFGLSGGPITTTGTAVLDTTLGGTLGGIHSRNYNDVRYQATGNYITALTGDVVATGPGSVAATIQANAVTTTKINNNAVTYAKIQAATQQSLLGATGAGNFQEITLGTNLSMAGSVLNATGGGSGVTSIGTINSQTKSANGAVISGSSLVMQTGDTTLPGLLSVADNKLLQSKPNVFNVKLYGAVGDTTTNETLAFRKCMNALIANKGGVFYIPAGVYTVDSFPIPAIPVGSTMTIQIQGETFPVYFFGTVGTGDMPVHGSVVRCLSTTAGSAIVCDPNPGPDFSSVNIFIKDLEVRTYNNPSIGGIDLGYAAFMRLENVFVNTGIYNVLASQPTHGTAGIITPLINNGAMCELENVTVTGYFNGIIDNEHTDGNKVNVLSCYNGINLQTSNQASNYVRLGAYRNKYNVTVSGAHAFAIQQLNIEHADSATQITPATQWQLTWADVFDPSSIGVGDINYLITAGNHGPATAFLKIGGNLVNQRPIGINPFVDAAGNVGIGVNTPSQLFHVRKNQNGGTVSLLENTSNGTGAYLEYTGSNDRNNTIQFGLTSSNWAGGGLLDKSAGFFGAFAGGAGDSMAIVISSYRKNIKFTNDNVNVSAEITPDGITSLPLGSSGNISMLFTDGTGKFGLESGAQFNTTDGGLEMRGAYSGIRTAFQAENTNSGTGDGVKISIYNDNGRTSTNGGHVYLLSSTFPGFGSTMQFQNKENGFMRFLVNGNTQFMNAFPSGNTIFGTSTTENPSALVEMNSTTKGLLIPRLNTTQQNAISSPATGLVIYNTDTLGLVDYNGAAWLKERTAGGGGSGNTNSNVGAAFRFAIPNTNNIKTAAAGPWFLWDSATTNQLRGSVDTNAVVARVRQIIHDSTSANDTLSLFRAGSGQGLLYAIGPVLVHKSIAGLGNISITTGSDSTINAQLTGFTAGRVPYASSSSVLADNLNFKWQNSTNTLIIGNNAGSFTQNLVINGYSVSSGFANSANGRTLIAGGTYTDNLTSIGGSNTFWASDYISGPTFAASNTGVTYNNISSLIVTPPVAGTNITATHRFAIHTNDNTLAGLDGNVLVEGGHYITGGIYQRVRSITANYTVTTNDYKILIDATAGNVTVTLPAVSSVYDATLGTAITYKFVRMDNSGNTITVQRAGSDTINGANSFTLTTQYDMKGVQAGPSSAWTIE